MNVGDNFRQAAASAHRRAAILLEQPDEQSVRYACLELRTSLEYLLYDRLRTYKPFLDEEAIGKWTPKEVLTALLDVDPSADTSITFSIGREEVPGEPSKDMKVLGTDKRLKLRWANSRWHALSSFLHAPTLQQLEGGRVPDVAVMRKRAVEVFAHLDIVLKARVWNLQFGENFTLECLECRVVTKRLAEGVRKEGFFRCRNPRCRASYDFRERGQEVDFKLRHMLVRCDVCNSQFEVKEHLVFDGAVLSCPGCHAHWRLSAGLVATKIDVEEATG